MTLISQHFAQYESEQHFNLKKKRMYNKDCRGETTFNFMKKHFIFIFT
jgi:hypothetical protein